jgi:hypothetical protein
MPAMRERQIIRDARVGSSPQTLGEGCFNNFITPSAMSPTVFASSTSSSGTETSNSDEDTLAANGFAG